MGNNKWKDPCDENHDEYETDEEAGAETNSFEEAVIEAINSKLDDADVADEDVEVSDADETDGE